MSFSHLQTDRLIGMHNNLIQQLIWNVHKCSLCPLSEIKNYFPYRDCYQCESSMRLLHRFTGLLLSRGKLCFRRGLPGWGGSEQGWEDLGSCSSSCTSLWVILCTSFSLFAPWFLHLYACVLSHFSRVRLFVTPWTVACQAPLSMGFSSGFSLWSMSSRVHRGQQLPGVGSVATASRLWAQAHQLQAHVG